jgi:hypothetical protein
VVGPTEDLGRFKVGAGARKLTGNVKTDLTADEKKQPRQIAAT